jgi:hypothetical protein
MGPKPKMIASTQATGKRTSIPTAKAAAGKEKKTKGKEDDARPTGDSDEQDAKIEYDIFCPAKAFGTQYIWQLEGSGPYLAAHQLHHRGSDHQARPFPESRW